MKIETVNSYSALYAALQDFITRHGLLFNSAPWLKNYPAKNIFQCAILNNNNDVIGCFNYYIFKKTVFSFVITPPFSPNIDLFYINPSDSVVGKNSFNKDLGEALAVYFDALNVSYININLPETIIDTQPFIWKGYTSRGRFSYMINLKNSEEELWNNLSSEKRKSIKKAVKDGLIIEQSTDYELIYSLIIKSLERNSLSKNREIIKNILFSFANAVNSYGFVARRNNHAIGATFCIISRGKAIYLFGGFDADNKHHGAGVSCMWQSILKAKESGLTHFDFEGSMDPKIERYFREFGGELISYFSVLKVSNAVKIFLALKKHNPV